MKNEWIYYLNLSEEVGSQFLEIDKGFKEYGLSLVPIKVEDMLVMARSKANLHVVICIDKVSKLKYFNQRIRKIVKFLVRQQSINFYLLSSFDSLNDRRTILNRKNYFYTSLPCRLKDYTFAVSETIRIKDNKVNDWPGAKRRVYVSGENL